MSVVAEVIDAKKTCAPDNKFGIIHGKVYRTKSNEAIKALSKAKNSFEYIMMRFAEESNRECTSATITFHLSKYESDRACKQWFALDQVCDAMEKYGYSVSYEFEDVFIHCLDSTEKRVVIHATPCNNDNEPPIEKLIVHPIA